MPNTATQTHEISTREDRNVSVDFRGMLDGAVTLDTLISIEEFASNDLILSSKQISSIELDILDDTVPIGQAVQFKVDATNADYQVTYLVDIHCITTDGQRLEGRIKVRVI